MHLRSPCRGGRFPVVGIRRLAESMPEFYQTRTALIFHSITGEAHDKGIYDCIEGLLNMTEN